MFEQLPKELLMLLLISSILISIILLIKNSKKKKIINSLNKNFNEKLLLQQQKYEYQIETKNNYIVILEKEQKNLKLSIEKQKEKNNLPYGINLINEKIYQQSEQVPNILGKNIYNNSHTYSEYTGTIGEEETIQKIDKIMKQFNLKYKIIKNVYLPKANRTTEIDIIVISEIGIYVIENKNCNGWIFGSYNNLKWTVTYNSNEKYQFYNPILQNNSHLEEIKKYIPPKYTHCLKSIIIFSDSATLKKVPESNDDYTIINTSEIYDLIKNEKNNKIIPKETIYNLSNYFYEYTKITEQEKQKHIDDINQLKNMH